ncbi:neuromedin-B [Gracilinanus agilis]|uniref:neuromedin-B n=1 Tax=Gracilinanus agilis TaxID=191870 RepID=UPI001CFD1478|nr:neuromedin-B [Gracilinanus agilis]
MKKLRQTGLSDLLRNDTTNTLSALDYHYWTCAPPHLDRKFFDPLAVSRKFKSICCLVFLAFLSSTSTLSLDFAEHRNKAAKIKIHPRGNLWATGHFMGKKSVEPLAFSSSSGTATHATLEEMRDRLSHDLVRVLWLKKSLGMSQEDPAVSTQDLWMLLQQLEK